MNYKTILDALKEYGSENVQTKLNEKGGESYCVSYIEKSTKEGVSFETALGWLEQDLSEIYKD